MEKMANSRPVWFVLVNDQGEPYKGTTADKVKISSESDIADFRDAVHAKNPNILIGIVPAQLLVYSNKAAFDKGNSLEEDDSIQSYGGSKKDALLVAVPDEFRPSKKQRQEDVGLRELYDFSSMAGLTRLPNVNELPALLLQPLPFRMEIIDSNLAKKIFDQNAPFIKCNELKTWINYITVKCNKAPLPDASENSWQSYYDIFLSLTEIKCIHQLPVEICVLIMSFIKMNCSCFEVKKRVRVVRLIHH